MLPGAQAPNKKKGSLLIANCQETLIVIGGAEERTRTSTDIHPLDPEPSASTSSATSARGVA